MFFLLLRAKDCRSSTKSSFKIASISRACNPRCSPRKSERSDRCALPCISRFQINVYGREMNCADVRSIVCPSALRTPAWNHKHHIARGRSVAAQELNGGAGAWEDQACRHCMYRASHDDASADGSWLILPDSGSAAYAHANDASGCSATFHFSLHSCDRSTGALKVICRLGQ